MWNDPEVIEALIGGVLEIVRRHFQKTGEILTNEQAHELLMTELRDGQSKIAAWFIEKGLPIPE